MLSGGGDEWIHRRHCFYMAGRGWKNSAPPAVGVCAPFPGKPYSTVEGRKHFDWKSLRRRCEFAPHSRESLILPSRGANLAPGKAAAGRESLRLTPGKALFLRRGAQTFCREKPPPAVRVGAPPPGKLYSTVEGRKPCAWKSRRRRWEFAPHPRESLIPPSGGRKPCAWKSLRRAWEFAPHSRESLIPPSGGRKPCAWKSLRRAWKFAPHPRESLIPPSRGANLAPGSRRTQMQTPASVSSLTDAGVCPLKFYTSLKSYSAGLSGWISGIISTSRFW